MDGRTQAQSGARFLCNRNEFIKKVWRKYSRNIEADVSSDYIGSLVMKALLGLDKVGYIRYASVYKNFEDAGDFEDFVNELRS